MVCAIPRGNPSTWRETARLYIIVWPKMAGEAESEGMFLRLPVHYGAITGLVYAPEVDAVIVSTVVGGILVYDASSFKLLFENST